MDYQLNTEQIEVVNALRDVLERYAGPARARVVLEGSGVDLDLYAALEELGIFDPDLMAEYGPHVGVVLVEEIAAAAGILPIGPEFFLRHALDLTSAPTPFAVVQRDYEPGVPFGSQARTLIRIDESVRLLEGAAEVGEENRTFPLPIAPLGTAAMEGKRLDISPDRALAWWRIGLAAEMVGAASTALRITIEHLTARTQFGRPLATRQAIQHRLAEVHVKIEGARWLTRYAAAKGAEPEHAAACAAAATTMARLVMWETQQLQGAIGFTTEYDLHLFTLRLHVLRLQLDGSRGGHAKEAARQRWLVGTATAEAVA